jgi:hypothetical protein
VGTDSGKEKIAGKVLTKNEKPKLVLVEYYVFDGQFACYRNSREKGQKREKETLNFRQLAPKASHIQGIKPIIKIIIKIKTRKATDPCHVTLKFTVSKVSENLALDYLSMSFLLASF